MDCSCSNAFDAEESLQHVHDVEVNLGRPDNVDEGPKDLIFSLLNTSEGAKKWRTRHAEILDDVAACTW